MKNRKLSSMPAFPLSGTTYLSLGMSKRFYAACTIMQGLLTNSKINFLYYNENMDHCHKRDQEIIKRSYQLAEELLKQENE